MRQSDSGDSASIRGIYFSEQTNRCSNWKHMLMGGSLKQTFISTLKRYSVQSYWLTQSHADQCDANKTNNSTGFLHCQFQRCRAHCLRQTITTRHQSDFISLLSWRNFCSSASRTYPPTVFLLCRLSSTNSEQRIQPRAPASSSPYK